MSSPQVTPPATFPARLAWLQHNIKARIRPYHLVMGALVGLITTLFIGVILLMILVATNFNILSWME